MGVEIRPDLGWASFIMPAEWHPEKAPATLNISLCKEWVKKVKTESHCWLVRSLSGSSIFCTHIRSRVQNSQYPYKSWAWKHIFVTPVLVGGWEDRQILKASLSASLAKTISYRFRYRPYLKI